MYISKEALRPFSLSSIDILIVLHHISLSTCNINVCIFTGYNIEVATNDNIKKQFGANACAGCSALGFDVGVGMVG